MLVIESFQSQDEFEIIKNALADGEISERDTVWTSDSGQTVVDAVCDPDDVGGEEFMDIGSVKEYLAD